MTRFFAAVMTALCLCGTLALSAAAATTPTPQGTPDIPPPTDCTVAPRLAESLLTLTGTPAAGQVPASGEAYLQIASLPAGKPVDAATQKAIYAVLREWTACVNAGDQLRALGLFTDDYFRRIIIGNGPFPKNFPSQLEATKKLPKKDWLPVPTMKDWRLLPDGRVGVAVISVRNKSGNTPFYIFAKHGNHWLIDEIVEITGKVP